MASSFSKPAGDVASVKAKPDSSTSRVLLSDSFLLVTYASVAARTCCSCINCNSFLITVAFSSNPAGNPALTGCAFLSGLIGRASKGALLVSNGGRTVSCDKPVGCLNKSRKPDCDKLPLRPPFSAFAILDSAKGIILVFGNALSTLPGLWPILGVRPLNSAYAPKLLVARGVNSGLAANPLSN